MFELKPYALSVAMYLRKSRSEEKEDTEAVLERHKAELTKYAKVNNINVKKVYQEIVSGDSLFCRPQMCQLLKDIEDKLYTGLLCIDIDRLGRGNMQEQGLILDTLKNANTAIITPDKIYDLNDELDETQTEFKTFFARQELKMIKKRLSRGTQATIAKGGYVSNVPFGYDRAYKEKTPTLSPSEEEAKYVKLMFDLYIQGEGSQNIADILSNMGVKPHRGERFNRTSIVKILKNEVYIGKIIWGRKKHHKPKQMGQKHTTEYLPQKDWKVFDGIHPPIIEKETFERVNLMLKDKYHPPYREPNQIMNPLSGILICQFCRKTMTRRSFHIDRKYQSDHLLCTTVGCCKSEKLVNVEKSVISALNQEYHKIKEEYKNNANISIKHSEIVNKMQIELKKIELQKSGIYDKLEQNIYDIDTFTSRIKIINGKIENIKFQISNTETQQQTKCKQDKVIKRIEYVLQNYWGLSPANKNQLLKSVIDTAIYYKPKHYKSGEFDISITYKDI
jgi:site-specific DNA recombinase